MQLFFEDNDEYIAVQNQMGSRMTPPMWSTWTARSWNRGMLVSTDHPQVVRIVVEIAEECDFTILHGADIPPESPDDYHINGL